MEGAERLIHVTGKKPLQEYIDRRQAMIPEWVALQPVFEVSVKVTWLKGGGRAQDQWCCQTAVERQLKTTLKEILAAARDLRRQ